MTTQARGRWRQRFTQPLADPALESFSRVDISSYLEKLTNEERGVYYSGLKKANEDLTRTPMRNGTQRANWRISELDRIHGDLDATQRAAHPDVHTLIRLRSTQSRLSPFWMLTKVIRREIFRFAAEQVADPKKRRNHHNQLRTVCTTWNQEILPIPTACAARLPTELLLAIFSFCIAAFPTSPIHDAPSLALQFKQRADRLKQIVRFSSVCVNWRAAVNGYCAYWIDIPLNALPRDSRFPLSILDTWLPRSPGLAEQRAIISLKEYKKDDTHFHLRRQYGRVMFHPKLEAVSGIICEGDSVDFVQALHERSTLGGFATSWTMPKIRYFEFSQNPDVTGVQYAVERTRDEAMPPGPLLAFPNLETLRVLQRDMFAVPSFVSPNLKHLEIRSPSELWTRFQLKQSPNIETFHYFALSNKYSPDVAIPELPNLREYHGDGFDDVFRKAPNLQRLALWNPSRWTRWDFITLMHSLKDLRIVITHDDRIDWRLISAGLCERLLEWDPARPLERLEIDCSDGATQDGTAILNAILTRSLPEPVVNNICFINMHFDSGRCMDMKRCSPVAAMSFRVTFKGCYRSSLEEVSEAELLSRSRECRARVLSDVEDINASTAFSRLTEVLEATEDGHEEMWQEPKPGPPNLRAPRVTVQAAAPPINPIPLGSLGEPSARSDASFLGYIKRSVEYLANLVGAGAE